jgi:SAM-dependent methyltransferase
MSRQRAEQVFHDRQARARAVTFEKDAAWLAFDDDWYLDHESWVRPAFDQLGDLAGKTALDFGCGHGMAAVVLARRGACVAAFDVSGGYLAEARARARANHVAVHFARADGEHLPFADGVFDAIWGSAVLHHLDLAQAGPELWRVLKPGGIGVFCEPWGGNSLLNWARRRLPYPAKERTADERPLTDEDVHTLGDVFSTVNRRGYQFLSMVGRLVGRGRLAAGLDCCDRWLLKRMSQLERYCRYVVITLQKTS